jgi:hypothetical protein
MGKGFTPELSAARRSSSSRYGEAASDAGSVRVIQEGEDRDPELQPLGILDRKCFRGAEA